MHVIDAKVQNLCLDTIMNNNCKFNTFNQTYVHDWTWHNMSLRAACIDVRAALHWQFPLQISSLEKPFPITKDNYIHLNDVIGKAMNRGNWNYRKIHNIRKSIVVITLKFEQCTVLVTCLEDADRITNIADPDLTAPQVWFKEQSDPCFQFAQT